MGPGSDPLPTPRANKADPLLAGESPARHRLDALITRVAGTPRTTVLVRGERGSGRRLAARLVHARSARREGPFVEIRAAESHAPGFEGDVFGPQGRLHATDGGTVLLSEIQALSASAQAALVRELTEPRFDIRFIATSASDLDADVAEGRLREDLFYRINVLLLSVPALRERRDDVLPLAMSLLARPGGEMDARTRGLSASAAAALTEHPWPGNLRELRGVLEAAAARAGGGTIGREDLALPGSAPARHAGADPFDGERTLRVVEERLIQLVLDECGGNKSRAARMLGVNRQTLYNKLRELAATRP